MNSPAQEHKALPSSVKVNTITPTMLEILSLLSKPDALKIFSFARKGLRSNVGTPSEVGLSKKQYYTRLKQLVDLELIEKREIIEEKKGKECAVIYTITLLGNLVYRRCVLEMEEMLCNTSTLKAVDILYHSSKFDPEEIVQFMLRYM